MYDRRSPLTVAQQSLGYDLKRVMPGDCIISFSRKDIYALRASVQQQTGHRCCVVYGALPPETRSGQAQLFNDPTSGGWMQRLCPALLGPSLLLCRL